MRKQAIQLGGFFFGGVRAKKMASVETRPDYLDISP
jgi:hypothetical protein